MANDPAAATIPPINRYDMEHGFQANIRGFRDFLVKKLVYLSEEVRWSLTATLNDRGWPLHLRSLDTANHQLKAGAPWSPVDHEALLLLSMHRVKIEDVAGVFFEGRTVDECQDMLETLKARVPIPSVEDNEAQSCATPSNDRLIKVSSSERRRRTPPDTSHADNNKFWVQKDRDIIWDAIQQKLTPKQIQEQHFPFRSESAIESRMCKERKLRGAQIRVNWSVEDDRLLMKLVDEGHSFEDIGPRLARERTPQAVEVRHKVLKKRVEAKESGTEINPVHIDGEEEAESGDIEQDAQMDAEENEERDYKETPTESKPRSARKTVPSSTSTPAKAHKVPSITPIRTKLLNSIDARYLPKEKKDELKKALGRNNWPTHFASIEDYNAPLPEVRSKWAERDVKALRIIRDTVPDLPIRLIQEFFPGRTASSIRNQCSTRKTSGQGSAKQE